MRVALGAVAEVGSFINQRHLVKSGTNEIKTAASHTRRRNHEADVCSEAVNAEEFQVDAEADAKHGSVAQASSCCNDIQDRERRCC